MAYPRDLLSNLRKVAMAAILLLNVAAPVHAKARPPLPGVHPMSPPANVPVTSRNGTTLPSYDTTYYFDQLIDHNNPSLGTFQQRYWHTYEFYEPGKRKTYRSTQCCTEEMREYRRTYHSVYARRGERGRCFLPSLACYRY